MEREKLIVKAQRGTTLQPGSLLIGSKGKYERGYGQTAHDWTSTEGLVPISHHPLNQRCFAHSPLRRSTTQRKLATPDSPKRLQKQHTHKRHATPAPAHTTPAHSDLFRTACAPTSTHSNGFCVCIASSSSSSSSMGGRGGIPLPMPPFCVGSGD
jgi:hypothetical protein